jgi:phosphoserine phosphatase
MTHAAYVTTFIASGQPIPTDALPAGHQEWLEDGVALDVWHDAPLENPAALQATMALSRIDMITQPSAQRRKKLLIADMDSTLIEQECIDEMAAALGIKDQIAGITARAMNGELDFKAALNERVALLKGLREEELQQVYDERITLMPGAKVLAETMRANGAHLVIVSGGFTFFTALVREALSFHEAHSNVLEIEDGQLTGRVTPPLFDSQSKLNTLNHLLATRQLSAEDVLAIGDGANDIPMLQAAGLGVACHAKPVVQEQCAARLNFNDLSALLYVQGYRKGGWV